MKKFKIKKGDKVILIAGKDKGKTGIVEKMITETNKVIVAGLNKVRCFSKKKHQGEVVQKEMPVHISNVAHLDPVEKKATRVRFEINGDVKKMIAKRSGSVIREL